MREKKSGAKARRRERVLAEDRLERAKSARAAAILSVSKVLEQVRAGAYDRPMPIADTAGARLNAWESDFEWVEAGREIKSIFIGRGRKEPLGEHGLRCLGEIEKLAAAVVNDARDVVVRLNELLDCLNRVSRIGAALGAKETAAILEIGGVAPGLAQAVLASWERDVGLAGQHSQALRDALDIRWRTFQRVTRTLPPADTGTDQRSHSQAEDAVRAAFSTAEPKAWRCVDLLEMAHHKLDAVLTKTLQRSWDASRTSIRRSCKLGWDLTQIYLGERSPTLTECEGVRLGLSAIERLASNRTASKKGVMLPRLRFVKCVLEGVAAVDSKSDPPKPTSSGRSTDCSGS